MYVQIYAHWKGFAAKPNSTQLLLLKFTGALTVLVGNDVRIGVVHLRLLLPHVLLAGTSHVAKSSQTAANADTARAESAARAAAGQQRRSSAKIATGQRVLVLRLRRLMLLRLLVQLLLVLVLMLPVNLMAAAAGSGIVYADVLVVRLQLTLGRHRGQLGVMFDRFQVGLAASRIEIGIGLQSAFGFVSFFFLAQLA